MSILQNTEPEEQRFQCDEGNLSKKKNVGSRIKNAASQLTLIIILQHCLPYHNSRTSTEVIQQINENGWEMAEKMYLRTMNISEILEWNYYYHESWIFLSSLNNFIIPFWFLKLALDWDEKLDCIFFKKLYKMVSGTLRRKKNKPTTTT